MLKIRPITNVLGILLIILGLLMLTGLFFSYHYDSRDQLPLIKSAAITAACGVILSLYRKGSKAITKREGYIIVALGWLAMIGFGMLPYIFSNSTPTVIDALFESASGFTSTGATVLNDIEIIPHGVLFWRHLTQWIGGMGIIVLTVAIFPLLGIGGVELFVAEVPGPTSGKIHPRITVTARRLWFIYLALTAIVMALYKIFGMTLFDALCHSFTTMATGGYSTKNASMGHFSMSIQWIAIIFMFLGGTNYTLIYLSLQGRFKRAWQSDEFKMYLMAVIGLASFLAAILIIEQSFAFEPAVRTALFHIISMMTTTGYVTADYTSWGLGVTAVFFGLLFAGTCAGSTSGGIKMIRHLVFMKNSILEFKRILHPRALIRIKIDREIVPPRILTHILVFLLVYLFIFIIGTIFVSFTGVDFTSAAAAVASALGNVGPAIGSVGPVSTFFHIPDASKILLCVLMLLGRLELFTILILFTPYFWRPS